MPLQGVPSHLFKHVAAQEQAYPSSCALNNFNFFFFFFVEDSRNSLPPPLKLDPSVFAFLIARPDLFLQPARHFFILLDPPPTKTCCPFRTKQLTPPHKTQSVLKKFPSLLPFPKLIFEYALASPRSHGHKSLRQNSSTRLLSSLRPSEPYDTEVLRSNSLLPCSRCPLLGPRSDSRITLSPRARHNRSFPPELPPSFSCLAKDHMDISQGHFSPRMLHLTGKDHWETAFGLLLVSFLLFFVAWTL